MIKGCVGDIKINFGKWYSPVGKSAYECTICEFCVQNGCVEKSDMREIDEINQCVCNCINKQNHLCIEEYACTECLISCNIEKLDTNKCTICKEYTNYYTKYCAGCSAIFEKCIYCGNHKNADGERIH